MRSLLDLLVASLTVIHASRSRVRRSSPRISISRSNEAVEANTYGLPEGGPLAKELRRWFKRQRRAVLKLIPDLWPLPMHFPLLGRREWVDPMAAAMVPLLAPYWNESYQESQARLSRGRAVPGGVVNPHLRQQIERQSFNFCQSTNESTSRRLEDALDALKHEFVQGLVEQGEAIPKLTKRVNEIFEGLTERHAATIAATEASRAVHAAQEQAALESGVVAGKEWLISADACELCQKIATESKRIRLGQAFAIVGNHPEYSTVMHPPAHPNCQCSLVDVLMPEYGGPVDVDWGLTLFQPQTEVEGGQYEPPRGLKVPEPEPERIKEKPKVPGPAGPFVSSALELPKEPLGDKVRGTLDAIDKIHGDGKLPKIPIRAVSNAEANGQFFPTEHQGKSRGIEINRSGSHPNMTLAHEIGHFLDYYGETGDREGVSYRPWGYDSVFKDWYNVVRKTDSIGLLQSRRDELAKSHTNHEYYDYLLHPVEMWARSYAQYVATKSGDATLKGELDTIRNARGVYQSMPTQWTDEDFKPISAAIDEMFRKVGWVK